MRVLRSAVLSCLVVMATGCVTSGGNDTSSSSSSGAQAAGSSGSAVASSSSSSIAGSGSGGSGGGSSSRAGSSSSRPGASSSQPQSSSDRPLEECVAGSSSSMGSSSSGPRVSPDDVADYRAFFDLFLQKSCEWYARCEPTLGPAYPSQMACLNAYDAYDGDMLLYYGLTYVEFLAYGYAVPTSEQQTACYDALAAATCDAAGLASLAGVCNLFAPRNPAAIGARCGYTNYDDYLSLKLCGLDAYCDTSGSGACSVCVALAENGQPCDSGSTCASGYCAPGDGGAAGTCAPPVTPPALGEPCNDDAPTACVGNLVCAGPVDAQTCRVLLAEGEVCDHADDGTPDVDEGRCLYGLECRRSMGTYKCAAPSMAASTCLRNPRVDDEPCNRCVFSMPDATQGTCNPPMTTALVDGDPCIVTSYIDGMGALSSYGTCGYSGGLWADTQYETAPPYRMTSCTCRSALPQCAPCTVYNACGAGRCIPTAPDGALRCMPPGDVGDFCYYGPDCLSGACDSLTSTCAAAPMCP